MGIEMVFRIAAIGLITTVMCQLLTRAGREEIATLAAIAGLVIVIVMVTGMLGDLFGDLQEIFMLE